MSRLFFRSLLVLLLLFGLLFAVGIAVLYHYHQPLGWAIAFSVIMVLLQYIFGPMLLEMFFRINWFSPDTVSPELATFLSDLCRQRRIPMPRFGVIEDGNPNAFTYGHVPGDARLVVTRGLINMLSEEELEAVVAHEVGHIAHYDFIVMTVAALVPMLLYVIYVWMRGRRHGAAAMIGFGAYLAYIVSHYIVLFLSRVREYYADEHSAMSIPEANAISTALVKIAYGLARIPETEAKQGKKASQKTPVAMMGAMGVSNISTSRAMAITATDTSGNFSPELMMRAMQWDLWNPWARWYEFQSTHPLVARRVLQASRIATQQGQAPMITASTERYDLRTAFLRDLLIASLPWIGVIIGICLTFAPLYTSAVHFHFPPFSGLGLAFILGGVGWLGRTAFSYLRDYRPATIVGLVGELDVSHIHCIPVAMHGKIIGRGVPGLIWSKDLVMQDETGFTTLIYKQPLGILGTIFGIFRAKSLLDKVGTVHGWYRRGPVPYVEVDTIQFDDGDSVRCYWRQTLYVLAAVCVVIGLYIQLVMN